jgi:hypothetical protein
MDYDIGYDLMSKGNEESREETLNLFNEHYNFSKETLTKMKQSSALSAGIYYINKRWYESFKRYEFIK